MSGVIQEIFFIALSGKDDFVSVATRSIIETEHNVKDYDLWLKQMSKVVLLKHFYGYMPDEFLSAVSPRVLRTQTDNGYLIRFSKSFPEQLVLTTSKGSTRFDTYKELKKHITDDMIPFVRSKSGLFKN